MTLIINLPDEQTAVLTAKAQSQGMSAEEYARQVLEHDLADLTSVNKARRPISETIREIWTGMPDDVQAKLPKDGASQVDHYVYGLPKRDQ